MLTLKASFQHCQLALIVFVLAAVGGATVFFGFHLRGRALPVPLLVGHGLIAATGLGLLLKAIYG